jgi:uncharacterized protein (DUF2336 family)
MDWHMQDSSPHIASLMVRLYDRHRLYALAKNDDPSARGELAGVMVDLLRLPLTEREKELITDVMVGLMRQAEIDLRRALAERLSAMDNVPLRMVLHLAGDEISVADKILRYSPVLEDMDLIYIVKSHGSDHWRSIAQREALGAIVINLLVETRDLPTAAALSENMSITLTPEAIDVLSDMARESDRVAIPLIHRSDVPASVVRQVYQFVGAELKAYIDAHYDMDIADAADQVVLEFVLGAEEEHFPAHATIRAAESLQQKGLLSLKRMMESLQQGMVASFVAQFSVHYGLPAQAVHDAVLQNHGKSLAHLCRGLNISKPDFMSIFLLTNKARVRGQKIVNQSFLVNALRHFDEADGTACRKLIASLRQ